MSTRNETIKRIIAGGDRNEGSKSPYVNTKKRQGYTNKSVQGQGGTLFGGKTPGYSNRSREVGRDMRASSKNEQIASGKMPLFPNNTLQSKVDDSSEKVPRQSLYQRAELEKRAADYYTNKLKKTRRDADKKRLGKRFNGSDGSTRVHIRYRGNQNA